jgi:radical SAM superfamily enzyme YgiQ (UPF0313 family)
MTDIIIWNCLNENFNVSRPLGAHQISSWLQKHGYSVKVIDFCHLLTTDELVDLTEMYIGANTIAIGVSTTFWRDIQDVNRMHKDFKQKLANGNFFEPEWVIKAREIIENRNNHLKWLLGGTSITYDQLGYLPNRFDWMKFNGHAEDSLLKYLDEYSNKTITRKMFDIKTQTAGFHDGLGIQPSEVLPIELGRGCQFKCRFCSYPLIGKKKGTYTRDLSFVKEELLYNYERFGVTRYTIMDDTVNESVEKIEELANIAKQLPFNLEWVGYNRLDLIGTQPHTVDLLRESGLKSTFFGIESFHPDASKSVGKGWNGKHGKDYIVELDKLWNHDISMTLSFIVGLTGEDEQSLTATQDFCIKNNISSWIYLQLYLNRNSALSEFEKNYHQYGFKFPKPLDNSYWTNDLWNTDSATKKALELNYDPVRMSKVKPMTWYIPVYAALGYSFNEIKNIPVQLIDKIELKSRATTFVKNYINTQKKN